MSEINKMSDYIAGIYQGEKNIKILHYNAKDVQLKQELAARGYENFLDVSFKKASSGLNLISSKRVAQKNNADILILDNADFGALLYAFQSSAELIFYMPNHLLNNFSFPPILAFLQAKKKPWNFSFETFAGEGGRRVRAIVFKRKYLKRKTARRYLSPKIQLDDFFSQLNREGLEYAILRWHEEIPFADINEDIDLMVSDVDIHRVQEIIDEKVGIVPFDVYSASGLPGSEYKEMAYYRPHLAEQIIQSREIWNGKFYIPDPWHRFLSLMYHAVYHKGETSGLPVAKQDEGRKNSDHDYPAILERMAAENEVEIKDINLTDCHHFLEQQGWAPATDTIRKLSQGNGGWLESVIKENEFNFKKEGELMVFVIREWASKRGLNGYIADWFEDAGLNVVRLIELDANQQKKAAQNLRGGNWGKGPWPVSGGNPAAMLIVYDYHPKPLKANAKKKYPHVSNEHYLLKEKLRKEINMDLRKAEKTNPIHSSDDEIEALEYIQAILPEALAAVETTIKKWDMDYETREKVIKDISENKRRAKVEIIEFKGQKAVKKTYKAGKERFLNREKYVYGEMSKECGFIPELLDSGGNYIVIPYYETLRLSRNERTKIKMLKKYKKEIYDISEFFYTKGYALIDFHPGNLLITKNGLKVIDFEFLYRYETLPESSKKTFDLLGFPIDFTGDKPYGIKGRHRKKIWNKILN